MISFRYGWLHAEVENDANSIEENNLIFHELCGHLCKYLYFLKIPRHNFLYLASQFITDAQMQVILISVWCCFPIEVSLFHTIFTEDERFS